MSARFDLIATKEAKPQNQVTTYALGGAHPESTTSPDLMRGATRAVVVDPQKVQPSASSTVSNDSVDRDPDSADHSPR